MATNLETRLRRLEAATGGGLPPCPECGRPHDGDDDHDATYEVVWLGDDEDPEEPYFCETCVREIPEIVWDDATENARQSQS